MPYVRLSAKEKTVSISVEQVFAGDQALDEVKAMLLASEAARDDAAIWFDVVVDQLAHGDRKLFVAKYGKMVVGYMILKPQQSKISSIFVERTHRGKRVAESLYGMGVVSLGTAYPYTAFVHEMVGEFQAMVKANGLVFDDTGPLYVINPGDGIHENWTQCSSDSGSKPDMTARQNTKRRLG